MRTVLNEKQLHTLRTCYAANPRPDALMKEQLVEMTGLSPRVIRVWFQNKRCKDKKKSILMKQLQQQHSDKAVGTPRRGRSGVGAGVRAAACACPFLGELTGDPGGAGCSKCRVCAFTANLALGLKLVIIGPEVGSPCPSGRPEWASGPPGPLRPGCAEASGRAVPLSLQGSV